MGVVAWRGARLGDDDPAAPLAEDLESANAMKTKDEDWMRGMKDGLG